MANTAVLSQVVAGPFTLTWAPAGSNAASLGVVGDGGIKEFRKYESEEISADLLGNAVVDAVHLGSQMFLEFNLEEANRDMVMRMTHPFQVTSISGAESNANLNLGLGAEGEFGVPGQLYTGKYGQLVATPAFSTNNPAGAQTTPVRTYPYCTLAPNFEMRTLLSARRRVIPVRLRVWPVYDSVLAGYRFYSKS